MPTDDYIGNFLADALADAAATRSQSRRAATMSIEMWHKRAYLIALRLAFIEARSWEHDKQRLMPAPQPLPPWNPPELEERGRGMREEINAMGHRLKLRRDRIFCLRCRHQRGKDNHVYWTRNRCCPKRQVGDDARELPDPRRRRVGIQNTIYEDPSRLVTPAQRRHEAKDIRIEAAWRRARNIEQNKTAWKEILSTW